MREMHAWALVAAVLAGLTPASASAQEGRSQTITGSANASVVDPTRVVAVDALSFGTFVSPASSGTVTVTADGVASGTGGLSGITDFTLGAEGPAAGSFSIEGGRDLHVLIYLPNRITLSSGTASMQVRKFTTNAGANGRSAVLDTEGRFTLQVGATLDVDGGQTSGTYSGTYDVTVAYL